MEKKRRSSVRERIERGKVQKQDVNRRLAELAFGKANDCVRLALEEGLDLDELDLTLLSEVKRNSKGDIEVRLVDRLKVLEQLAQVVVEDEDEMEAFMQSLQGGEGT